MGILKLIDLKDMPKDVIVYRYDIDNKEINKGSKLTVREGQACIFCHKGKMADVFLPGFYTLDTDNIPLLTKLMSWKYGFEKPFKSDVYFVSTKQFTNMKWGTSNPFLIRDPQYGAIRARAFGTYAFRVKDPYVFMTEVSGTIGSFATRDINEWLRSTVVTRVSDIVGESKLSVLEMAGNLVEFGEGVKEQLVEIFDKIGIQITQFNFENFSLPKEVEEAIDKSSSLNIMGGSMGVYTQKAFADSMVAAANNQGAAGQGVGTGMGFGMGMGMAQMYTNMAQQNMAGFQNQQPQQNQQAQASQAGSKFCPDCGKPVPANSKFCPECGRKMEMTCPECGKPITAEMRFCTNCGKKLF